MDFKTKIFWFVLTLSNLVGRIHFEMSCVMHYLRAA